MIIGIDASRANLQHKTGTEWYSFYLIQNLAAIDKENTYRLYINKPARPELREAIKDNPNFSFNLLRWPFYSFWTLGRLTLEMLWRRPDVLFVPAHALPLFGPLKTVNTIHDVAFFREERLYRSIPVKTGLPISRRREFPHIRTSVARLYPPLAAARVSTTKPVQRFLARHGGGLPLPGSWTPLLAGIRQFLKSTPPRPENETNVAIRTLGACCLYGTLPGQANEADERYMGAEITKNRGSAVRLRIRMLNGRRPAPPGQGPSGRPPPPTPAFRERCRNSRSGPASWPGRAP